MESATKKSRVDAGVTPPQQQRGLPCLPPAVVNSIFEFVLQEIEIRYVCAGFAHCDNFMNLATVSKEWHSLADEFISERALHAVLLMNRQRMTRKSMLEMRRRMTLRRGHVQRMEMRGVPDFGAFTRDAWATALSLTPRVKEINFDIMDFAPPHVKVLAQIVQAAAQRCPQVDKLIFSRYIRPESEDYGARETKQTLMRVLVTAVFDAMKIWSKHGGLQHLHLAMHDFIKSHETAKEYIDNIVAFAPNIQLLNGSGATTEMTHYVSCKELWMLDLETWQRFCQTCDQLTHLDWACLPFATEFFEIFGTYPKPKLQRLSLTTAGNWNWKKYLRTIDARTKTALETTGYRQTARNIYRVVEACPNLQMLTVDWFDEPSGRGLKKSMNPEIFGDDFCEALARSCKRLSTLCILPATSLFASRGRSSLVTFTDRSMVALATLPELVTVQIAQVTITGDGLFELVVMHAASTRKGRQYIITLGDASRGETARAFYGAMIGFLERLAAYDGELPCASRPVMLQLISANEKRVDEGFSAEYFAKALMLADKIKKKHPTIELRGLVRGYDDEYCVVRCVQEFGFATAGVMMPEWADPDHDVLKDEPIDGVFVNRTYVDGERSDDEEEPAEASGGEEVGDEEDDVVDEDDFDSGDDDEDLDEDEEEDDDFDDFDDDDELDDGFDFEDGDY